MTSRFSAPLLVLTVVFAMQGAPADEVCAGCHRQIAESYRQTGMGRSFFQPMQANTVEDYTRAPEFYHALSDTHYRMLIRDGAYYQRRWQTGFEGSETNVEEMKIDYVLGSGNHARSYLHRTANGALIELPLGWYSEKGRFWGMSPGFDTRHPLTRRFVSYECMFCHNAYPRIPEARAPVFTGGLPEGIDCQRCHGPGARHVRQAQTQGAKLADIRAAIVNPARLSPKAQMEVCMQCHLEPTSGRLPAIVRQFSRGPFSYRPGEPLENFQIYFDHAPGAGHDDKLEIASSAYRLRKSRCFLESRGAMTCLTCHNPHQIPRGAEAVKHYDAACRQCHATALQAMIGVGKHTAASNCASCHMPKRRTEDVVHVVVTDHLIQRSPPARDLLAELPERHLTDAEEYHGEVVPYYPSPLPQTGNYPLYRAMAQVSLGNNLEKGIVDLTREVERLKPREKEFYMALGEAWRASGNSEKAAAAFEQAVRLAPDSAPALRSLAAAYHTLGQSSRSAPLLNRALRISPADAATWYDLGMLDAEASHGAEAIAKVEKAIALDPDSSQQFVSLAQLFAGAGNLDRAQATLQQALRIDPYDASAYDWMGRVLAGKSALAEALYHFEKATRLRPSYGPHLYDYALMLTRLNRPEEAMEPAEAAVRADPSLAEAHELLGGLYARRRQWPEAEREYRSAIEIQPDFDRARLDLGLTLAARGDLTGAIEQLQRAAQGTDAAAARQATEALQKLGKR